MKSYVAKPNEIERKWYIIDADGKTLGRLSSEVASILRGKRKPIFTPHVDTGDHVIIINAEKIVLTGNKLNQKVFAYHTGHPGGRREISYSVMMDQKPEKVVMTAVKGMLPKNSLGRQMLTKLRVYRGTEHDHAAQMPEVYEI